MSRRDPFADMGTEPAVDYETGTGTPTPRPGATVTLRGYVRKTPVRPAERRRRARKLTVTFSRSEIIQRLRALAERWDIRAPNGEVNVSAVVEYLLLQVLDEAESGAISPPRYPGNGAGGGKGVKWWV
jgi:hypothetical protein